MIGLRPAFRHSLLEGRGDFVSKLITPTKHEEATTC